MANKQISDLTEATSLGASDLFLIETSGGDSRKITRSNTSFLADIMTVVSRDATGDYVCDGTSDQTQINQAITAVNGNGGGTIYVKAGSYVISSSIIPLSNVHIIFDKNATVTRAIDIEMVSSSSEISNFKIEGGRFCNDTGTNEIITLSNINNEEIEIAGMTFVKCGGRAIYVGGDFKVINCNGIDIAQGIGTPDLSLQTSGAYKIPRCIIESCFFENQTFSGSQNEGVDINWHNLGYATINDCICRGYHDASFELNCRYYQVSNCIAIGANGYAPTPGHFAFAIKEEATDGRLHTGNVTNCIVINLNGTGYGFYTDRANSINFNGCQVISTDLTNSIGYRISGATSESVVMNGCMAQNCNQGIYSSIGGILTAIAFQDIDCTTRIYETGGSTTLID